jgi:site-specific DNA recombinase
LKNTPSVPEPGGDSPEGELTDGVLDQFAAYERAKIAERMRRGKLRKAREGKILANNAPDYGFRYTEARDGYEVDEPRMAVVRRVFEMVAVEGKKLHAVKKVLDREGVRTASGVPYWQVRFVRNVIRDDVYKPHTFEEVSELVAPEVAARLDPEKRYGVWYYNTRRKRTWTETRIGPGGKREYVKRWKITPRPREEWIAVPVPDSGIPREWVDTAREAIKDNQRSVSRGYRVWELGRTIARCGGCGRAMLTNSARKGLHYYRCPTRRDNGKAACEAPNRRAERAEAEVWESVRAILSDPERLRDDLDAMIEMKRQAYRNDPREEINHWLKILADANEKRAKYQRAYAADVMTLADLKARLAELEQERQIAERELASLRLREQEIADLESDRDALFESYAATSEEALDCLTPEERHHLYKRFGLEAILHVDGTTELVLGNLLSYEEVCTEGTLPKEDGQDIDEAMRTITGEAPSDRSSSRD